MTGTGTITDGFTGSDMMDTGAGVKETGPGDGLGIVISWFCWSWEIGAELEEGEGDSLRYQLSPASSLRRSLTL